MTKRYYAIPVLVYAEIGGTRTPEEHEQRIIRAFEHYEGVRPFIAEDYTTTLVEIDHDEDLSAMINTACQSAL